MQIKELETFLFTTSTEKERYRGFNFLYGETNCDDLYKADGFSKETFAWIKKTNIELQEDLKSNTNPNLFKQLNDELSVLNSFNRKKNLVDWVNCVRSVHALQSLYVDELKKTKKPIKYLIISEAPPLSILEDKLFSNYVFSNKATIDSKYRSVPFKVIKNLENDTKSSLREGYKGEDLISFYAEHRVAFLDIIPIPLPKIPGDLRKHWCTNFFYSLDNKKPRIIDLFNISFNRFLQQLNDLEFCDKLKITFMAPPIISENIIKLISNKNFSGSFSPEFTKIISKNRKLTYENLSKLISMKGGYPNEEKMRGAFK